jgi:ATP-dependent DNA helicase RecQ
MADSHRADNSRHPSDDKLLQSLVQYFGFHAFRPNQREIVEAILSNRDVFAALPTGGGKSLCYQLPGLMRPGLTVVVSPLIALMKDQVDAARENGIAAVFLNSTVSQDVARETWRTLSSGETKLLYVSPERMSIPEFRSALSRFDLSFVAIDEAHCISEWGHEFRPDYRTLGLLRSEFPSVPIAAFTATATRQVQHDVVRLLHLRKPMVVRASFDRPEIFYRVREKESNVDVQILDFVRKHNEEPGIVYRGTRKGVEKTTGYLASHGINAVAYHAGIGDDERRIRQEAFVRDEATVVVATIAFGMGIDKSNVRWVIHGDLPRSLESYYQETGRAARDGENADTVLFYGRGDIASVRWHIRNMEVAEERERAETRLQEVLRFVDSSVCRRKQLLAHFDEDYPGNCGRCDVCSGEVVMEDATLEAQKVLSAAVRTGERFGGHHLADILVGNSTDRVLDRGHNHLPTFGVGSDHERSWWLSFIGDLASGGYLVRGEGQTAGFHLSPRGRMLLKGKESFVAARRSEPRSNVRSAAPRTSAATVPGPAEDGTLFGRADQEELFQCLKRLRMRIARGRNVPPYVIFSDKTLKVMAMNRPTDEPALLRCHGVGERKLEAYGTEFLGVIREFLATGGCV